MTVCPARGQPWSSGSLPARRTPSPASRSARRRTAPAAGRPCPGPARRAAPAAGQFPGPPVFQPVQAEPAEPGPGFGPARRPGGPRPAAAEGRRSPRRSARGRAGRTGTRTRTGPGAARCAGSRARCPAAGRQPDLALVRDENAGQAVQQRRLARPARSHHRHDLSRARCDAGAAQRRCLPNDLTTPRASIIVACPPVTGAPPGRACQPGRGVVDPPQIRLQVYRPWSASRVSIRSPRCFRSVSSRMRCRCAARWASR